jgi:streptogramin lyase
LTRPIHHSTEAASVVPLYPGEVRANIHRSADLDSAVLRPDHGSRFLVPMVALTQPANGIGRITTAGVVTEFPVPTANSEPSAITAGPDGNLWFTEVTGNRIGRITPGGTVTEFTIPTAKSQPNAIIVGPDNALWFTESNAGKVGRIVP